MLLPITELTKLLKNTKPIKDFHSKKTNLETIDEIKDRISLINNGLKTAEGKFAEIKVLSKALPEEYKADAVGPKAVPKLQQYLNWQFKQMIDSMEDTIDKDVFKPLYDVVDVLNSKLQTLKIEKMIGRGRVDSLKQHPMYRPQKYF